MFTTRLKKKSMAKLEQETKGSTQTNLTLVIGVI